MMDAMRVVILRGNPVAPDPRVEKTARTLLSAGFDVRVVAWDRSGGRNEFSPSAIRIDRLPQTGQFGRGIKNGFSLIGWNAKLLYWLLKNINSYDVIHACDFDTIIPAVVVAILFRKKLVYDIYDMMAEASRGIPVRVRKAVRALDIRLMRLPDLVVLVDDSRREQIREARPKQIVVTYNSPEAAIPFTPQPPLSPAFNIGFVGILQLDRGLPEMIHAVEGDSRFHLHLGGFGGDEEQVIALCQGQPNITLYGKVDYSRAIEIYSGCQVMFAIYDPANPNHRYSSPNKFFEALLLGVPIIVAEGTGIDQLVKKHRTGFAVPYQNPSALKAVLEDLLSESEETRHERRIRLQNLFIDEFSWEHQGERLLNSYRSI